MNISFTTKQITNASPNIKVIGKSFCKGNVRVDFFKIGLDFSWPYEIIKKLFNFP